MNELIEHAIRKFNPGVFQSDEEIARQFVVRKCEFDIVREILHGNVDSPSCEHVLLVAPRGRGKTTLLARVGAELRTDIELSKTLLPIRFMEESQEIFDPADFWLEALFYLAREIGEHDSELSRELQITHAELARDWHGDHLEERARATVLDASDRLGKRLVLMVENLQALCEIVDSDFGWKLRGTLQTEPQIILVATATSRFNGLDDAKEPFFELFRIICLQPLDTGECRRLWQMVSGDSVTEREVRPLQILTGGNPRLLVIIGEFARHRSLRQLMEELVKLIDDHTEYFRAHLEVLAKTERRVYLAVIDLWQPSTTGEIAARARMDVRAVSALLGRLVERGAILVEGGGRKRTYVAAERLYSIYYKLRRERDEAAVVRNLIHFMAVFYSETELNEWSRSLTLEAMQWPAIREGIKLAIAESPQIARTFPGAAWQVTEHESDQSATKDHERTRVLLDEIRAAADGGELERVIEIADRTIASRPAGSPGAQEPVVALTLNVKGAAYVNLGNFKAAIAAWDEAIARFGDLDAPEFQVPIARALANKAYALVKLGENDAAIATSDEVLARFGSGDTTEFDLPIAQALFIKGVSKAGLGDLQASISDHEELVMRFGESDAPEVQLQVALVLGVKGLTHGRLGDTEEMIAARDEGRARLKAIKLPRLPTPLPIAIMLSVNVGEMQAEAGDAEEALRTCDEIEQDLDAMTGGEKITFQWRARRIRTKALLALRRPEAAMDAFRSAYAAFNPADEAMMREMLAGVPGWVAAGASERDLVEVLSSDREKADTLRPLVVALRQRAGEAVRAPGEVLEVAADIRERIEAKVDTAGGVSRRAPSV